MALILPYGDKVPQVAADAYLAPNATLIGMGATLLNGSVIGEESIVGANALVSEGKVFPPRALILGVPAQQKRELDAEAAQHGRRGAASYAARAKRYAEADRRVGG